MATYISGEIVHHLFKVLVGGMHASTQQVTSLSGAVYVDGTLASSASVSFTSMSNGLWRAQYTVPSGLSDGADLSLVVGMAVSGFGRTIAFRDQVMARTTPAAIRSYLQTNTIDVGLTDGTVDEVAAAVSSESVDATSIANTLLRHSVTTALASGSMDRHSLGAMVLMATNADTTSVADTLTVRHPVTDVSLFQYTITTGAGCPIQSIT